MTGEIPPATRALIGLAMSGLRADGGLGPAALDDQLVERTQGYLVGFRDCLYAVMASPETLRGYYTAATADPASRERAEAEGVVVAARLLALLPPHYLPQTPAEVTG